jgi:hypothetical protein
LEALDHKYYPKYLLVTAIILSIIPSLIPGYTPIKKASFMIRSVVARLPAMR